MIRKLLAAGAVMAGLGMSCPAHAQGVPGGVAYGVARGGETAGPVGAVVGGVVGGVIGGVEGVLGVDHRVSYVAPEPAPYRAYHHHRRHARHYWRHHHHSGRA